MVPGPAASTAHEAGATGENLGTPPRSTVDRAEIEKFAAMAEAWWDPTGKFRPLHRLNPVRIAFIRDRAAAHFGRDAEDPAPLAGLTLLDIGSGGGLLTEPMARLGAGAVGVDATPRNVEVARHHAEQAGIKATYLNCAAEDLVAQGARFDILLAMEIVEHVADVDAFLDACAKLLKPGGIMFLATMSRTMKSYAMAIVGAEYVLRWLPKGTHQWNRFLRPSEMARGLRHHGLNLTELTGVSYNPLKDTFHLSRDLDVNYMAVAKRG
ncbi:bifunctional 2-polyprenyl-6-hydroxyphenol methylase/3-demethylubiquinol 3-O-methyltransferase UbiG [Dongia sp.]|uniref:bifunctional 2-polyprenyl-6-hydroxyphenol methylase/3-demethylubiquinol 3-O-methyltransferase UbiG n=1 Tax=Dongia sp. TaxID=1977262 RepID=UPI0035B4DE02